MCAFWPCLPASCRSAHGHLPPLVKRERTADPGSSKVLLSVCLGFSQQLSPSTAAGNALEWPSHARRDPAAVEVARLRGHCLAVDAAAVERARVERHVIPQGGECRAGIGIAPADTGQHDIVDTYVPISRRAFPFAKGTTLCETQDAGRYVIARNIVARRVTRLQSADGRSRISDYLPAVLDLNTRVGSLCDCGAGKGPDTLLAGTCSVGTRPHDGRNRRSTRCSAGRTSISAISAGQSGQSPSCQTIRLLIRSIW